MAKFTGAVAAFAVALSLSGCAYLDHPSTYAPFSLKNVGGYDVKMLDGGAYRVTAIGTRSDPAQMSWNVVMLRAAEVSLDAGRPSFEVVSAKATASYSGHSGSSDFQSYNGTNWELVFRPTEQAPTTPADMQGRGPLLIKPGAVFDAAEVMKALEPIRRGEGVGAYIG